MTVKRAANYSQLLDAQAAAEQAVQKINQNVQSVSDTARKIRDLRKENEYDDPRLMMIVKDEAGQTVLSLPFFPGY